MQNRFRDGRGNTVILGQEIARGGEGAVFSVESDPKLVAKIYHSAVDAEKIEKLRLMATAATADLLQIAAWPTDILHDDRRSQFGILMPRVVGHREIHQLYSPAERKLYFPKADWSFLLHVGMNCAAAFETVHGHGHVIGDVNQSGIFVAPLGTVQLIDCDSFQISSGGRKFLCTVGVPQFTPPELQGKSFHGVERTQNHDLFGLAVVIFHLLFMGRHPFAGRYAGSGDMPIERAISERRFAFSRNAAAFQMQPPPGALSLSSLPRNVGDMLEQAFTGQSPGSRRPSAGEWRAALAALKKQLSSCPQDYSHRFPAGLGTCPWCAIAKNGGPNFFLAFDVAFGNGSGLDISRIDFQSIWLRIERLSPPAFQRPQVSGRPTSLAPLPLPHHVVEQRVMLRILAGVFVFAAVTAVVGAFAAGIVATIGIVLSIVFGCWYAVVFVTSGYKKERERRRDALRSQQARLDSMIRRFDDLQQTTTDRFRSLKADLAVAGHQGAAVGPEFRSKMAELEANRRDAQLAAYLDQQFIRNEKIPKIGAERLSTLLSYGIETAADIDAHALGQIPGFGPTLVAELIGWREAKKRLFRFDPAQSIAPAQVRGIVLRYQQKQQAYVSKLASGEAELHRLADDAATEAAKLRKEIQAILPGLWQAEADWFGI